MTLIGAALFTWAFIWCLKRNIGKHRKPRAMTAAIIKETAVPQCELCNGEDMYIGRSKIACPKCKRGAN
jgi:hypothetical protein